jgi:hypothetical protein
LLAASYLPITNIILVILIVESCIFVNLLLVRPFAESKDVVIEVINEMLFIVLTGTLMFFNKLSYWDEYSEMAYIFTISTNNLVV